MRYWCACPSVAKIRKKQSVPSTSQYMGMMHELKNLHSHEQFRNKRDDQSRFLPYCTVPSLSHLSRPRPFFVHGNAPYRLYFMWKNHIDLYFLTFQSSDGKGVSRNKSHHTANLKQFLKTRTISAPSWRFYPSCAPPCPLPPATAQQI
jgi:hypothetical protein